MNFESIIGFIAIMLISSLFNKKAVKPPTQPSNPVPSGKPVPKTSNSNQNRRKTLTSGLEDLFSELKGEFDKNFRDPEKKQSDSNVNQDVIDINRVEEKKNVHKSMSSRLKDNSKLDRDSVYAGEIGKEKICIEFDQKSLVQGIIMSEILQKPKSLRR